jgi:hypothetical protein
MSKLIAGSVIFGMALAASSAARAQELWIEQVKANAQPIPSVARFIKADRSIDRAAVEAELKRLANTPWEAEGLLYGLADAAGEAALPLLVERFNTSKRLEDQMGAAIAIRAYGGARAQAYLGQLKSPVSIESRQWAELLQHDVKGGPMPAETRAAEYDRASTFDQILPLQIALTVYMPFGDGSFRRFLVSPQQLLRIYGQAHACTRTENRDEQLVIAKLLELNGSTHVEGFLFQGTTFHPSPDVGVVNFLSRMDRDIYKSGEVRDMSKGRALVVAEVERVARWFAPAMKGPTKELATIKPVRLVGGQVSGWLYIHPSQMLDDDDNDGNPIDAGEAQLSSRVVDDAAVKANAFFTGVFFGKLSDLDGDGKVDLNTLKVMVDRAGFVDLDNDNVADQPHFSMTR